MHMHKLPMQLAVLLQARRSLVATFLPHVCRTAAVEKLIMASSFSLLFPGDSADVSKHEAVTQLEKNSAEESLSSSFPA